jgi:hypothetical protein
VRACVYKFNVCMILRKARVSASTMADILKNHVAMCKELIEDVERKSVRAKRKVEDDAKRERERTVAEAGEGAEEVEDKLLELAARMAEHLARSEQLGMMGKVAEGAKALDEADR